MLGVKADTLHKYKLEVAKNNAIKRTNGDLDARTVLAPGPLDEITWWLTQAHLHPRPLLLSLPNIFMQATEVGERVLQTGSMVQS